MCCARGAGGGGEKLVVSLLSAASADRLPATKSNNRSSETRGEGRTERTRASSPSSLCLLLSQVHHQLTYELCSCRNGPAVLPRLFCFFSMGGIACCCVYLMVKCQIRGWERRRRRRVGCGRQPWEGLEQRRIRVFFSSRG